MVPRLAQNSPNVPKKRQPDNLWTGLSPMDGITDEPFRLIQTEIAQPDVIFTEFVSAEGISRGGFKLYDQLLYKPQERPIIGQLFGKDPQSFYAGAIILAELGFDGIDINMGCPAKTVTANGSGAALIENPQLASEIIKSVANGINDWHTDKNALKKLKLKSKLDQVILRNQKYSQLKISSKIKPTLSVKTRLGINESIIDQWIPHLLKHPIDFLTIQGRLATNRSSCPSCQR
ncbi:MAG: tRNA-dihydrouridine synthase [Candidatus Shapirobacteria bacterium GW2011_GWE1_38_92]|uniref:tRNA-dihydrouridine synthase n=1 Tax=Candidatus Shapirobacteria bacterium GW2011_GWE1_38_92 TaxID=1618489 RepID=A0A0G0LSG2_9BACT|nr:MAG: tRNA-dihydrouridine synthase [Candidatus Shapirobacteria bacterium GW2011_GWE1_38_92]